MKKADKRHILKKLFYPAMGPFPDDLLDRVYYVISIVIMYGLIAITLFILLLLPLYIIGEFADLVFGFLEGIYGGDEYGL